MPRVLYAETHAVGALELPNKESVVGSRDAEGFADEGLQRCGHYARWIGGWKCVRSRWAVHAPMDEQGSRRCGST